MSEPKNNVLDHYIVPLGSNQVNIVFTGEGELTLEDFDALNEFVRFAKQQIERRDNGAKKNRGFITAACAAGEELAPGLCEDHPSRTPERQAETLRAEKGEKG